MTPNTSPPVLALMWTWIIVNPILQRFKHIQTRIMKVLAGNPLTIDTRTTLHFCKMHRRSEEAKPGPRIATWRPATTTYIKDLLGFSFEMPCAGTIGWVSRWGRGAGPPHTISTRYRSFQHPKRSEATTTHTKPDKYMRDTRNSNDVRYLSGRVVW
ncbi:hypothetical protein B0H16DRAFT_715103 [Mycena metata]|uniref:Uncharacterized protein n=1 Tax=Mycena metata TaxID=1033252 RepID=A0AAD7J6A1_9AGAR|nr:hypothetical protein B0H16DRAFT_715103 [Mycena metata]